MPCARQLAEDAQRQTADLGNGLIGNQQALEARGVGIPYFQRSSTMRPSFSTAAEAGFTEIEPITMTLIKS
jgi:hypothetical protein